MMRTFLLIPIICISLQAVAKTEMEGYVEDIEKKFEFYMRFAKERDKKNYLRRTVFGKDHGCLKAKFTVNPKLAKKYRKLKAFEKEWYPAWVRFSNDNLPGKDTSPAARGMSIKLVGVGGKKILKGEEDAVTQDFIMENHPTFFLNTAKQFRDFTVDAKSFLAANPETQKILDEMDANIMSDPLDGTYWIPTPISVLGKPAKYMAKPCKPAPDPKTKPMVSDDFFRENMITHLKESAAAQDSDQKGKEICFDFYMQFQRGESEKVEEPMKAWTGKFQHFATLEIDPHQDINAEKRKWDCESLSMTVWHTSDMEPLGSINEARRYVYKILADKRRKENNETPGNPPVPLEEPKTLDLGTL